jgi:hypothetical protein
MAQPWLKLLQEIPADATMPRVMTAAHPRAVGSYGPELVDFVWDRHAISLRWWQQLVIGRLLEHDVDGELVWPSAIVSTARQVGKSVLLRCLALFRVQRPDLFGDDVVMSLATSMKLAQELQRPAAQWAETHGWRVWRGAAYTAIHTPSGERWIVAAAASSHGYTVGLLGVDEAWGIEPAVIEDHAEPTLLASSHPQLLMTSTAHPDATALMLDGRRIAIDELESPGSTLIVEWSADPDAPDDDLDVWRSASPAWTGQRERMMRDRLAKARERGELSSFRTQYLNVWPERDVKDDAARLVDPSLFAASLGGGPVGLMSPVLVIEDDFLGGAVIALAERDLQGIVRVAGAVYESRAEAWAYVHASIAYPGVMNPTVLVGASLERDPEVEELMVTPYLRGGVETRKALSLYRSLFGQGRVVHDVDSIDLSRMLLDARTVTTPTGITLAHRTSRVDLVRAAIWAVAEAAQPASDPQVM